MRKMSNPFLAWMLLISLILTNIVSDASTLTVSAAETTSIPEGMELPSEQTEWFFNGNDSDFTVIDYEGIAEFYKNLYIDATNGKCEARDIQKDIILSAGTKLFIPVNGASTIKIVGYTGSVFMINNEPLEADSESGWPTYTYEYTGTDSAAIEVVIGGEETSTSYIRTIKVESSVTGDDPVEEEVQVDKLITFPTEIKAWYFDGTDGNASSISYQAGNEEDQGLFNNMYIDASASGAKAAVREEKGDMQVNKGTVFYVPVNGACTVTVNGYQGATLKINDEEVSSTASGWTDYTYAYDSDEAKIIKIEVGANTYIRRITTTYAGEGDQEPEKDPVDIAKLLTFPSDVTSWAFDGSDSEFVGINYQAANAVNTGVHKNMYIDASTSGAKFTARSGDIQVNTGTKFTIPVNRACTVTITAYNTTGIEANGETLTGSGTTNPYSFLYNYTGDQGIITFNITSPGYLYGIEISYPENAFDSVGTTGKISVWDFAGNAEKDTSLYANEIEASAWNNIEALSTNGVFLEAGTISFGDLSITYVDTDRVYASKADKTYTHIKTLQPVSFSDEYTTDGAYYCNGTAGSNRRYIQIDNVKAGDTIWAYMSTKAANGATTTTEKAHFEYLGSDGTQDSIVTLDTTAEKYSFQAQYSGSYKIYVETTNGTKPNFYRIVRVPSVIAYGTIQAEGVDITGYSLSFTNTTTQEVKTADVQGNSFAVALTPGYTYRASLKGVLGYDIVSLQKEFTVSYDEIASGKSDLVFNIEKVELVTATGSITGFTQDYDISNLGLTFVPDDTTRDTVVATMLSTSEYTADLEAGIEYTAVATGVNDYSVTNTEKLLLTTNGTYDVTMERLPQYNVTGSFLGVDASLVTGLNFTHEDGYVYAATINNGYQVALRDGAYTVQATAEGYTTNTTVTVSGGDVIRDLFFVPTTVETPVVEWTSDIYVGYPHMNHNYATVQSAVDACAAMGITSEEQRVTIHIAPGTYREQIVVNTPYITFVNDTQEEVLVTWYYGIGYYYYSAGSDGFYSAEAAHNQTEKNIASKWGASVYLQQGATGFNAINITFENSFNRYMTDEELADGVQVTADNKSDSSIEVERVAGLDVTSKAATERACAMAIDATETQFYNCSFLSSQDTLYTHVGTKGYFRNCTIEGNTDYIYGYGDYVFESCELSFAGYSDTNKTYGGYITAARGDNTEYGYLFNNCTITGNEQSTSTLEAGEGYLGRPWDAQAKVIFLNTTIERAGLITAEGWRNMGTTLASGANYHEYGTTYEDGTVVDLSGRLEGKVYTESEAAAVDVSAYFGAWTPAFYLAAPATPTPGAATPAPENGTGSLPGDNNQNTDTNTNAEGNASNNGSTDSATSTTLGTTTTTTTTIITSSNSSTAQSGTPEEDTKNEVIITGEGVPMSAGDTTSTDTEVLTEDFDNSEEEEAADISISKKNTKAPLIAAIISVMVIAMAGVVLLLRRKKK